MTDYNVGGEVIFAGKGTITAIEYEDTVTIQLEGGTHVLLTIEELDSLGAVTKTPVVYFKPGQLVKDKADGTIQWFLTTKGYIHGELGILCAYGNHTELEWFNSENVELVA